MEPALAKLWIINLLGETVYMHEQDYDPEKFVPVSNKIAELIKIMNQKIRNRTVKKQK